jgi:ubiquitin C-terminal hydrolase
MIDSVINSKVDKYCSNCNYNKSHAESSIFLQSPKYFIIIINRFSQIDSHISKNNTSAILHTYLDETFGKYKLIGVIDHIGPSITSGHYTCTLYSDETYFCNDAVITRLKPDFGDPGTAYILFYQRV